MNNNEKKIDDLEQAIVAAYNCLLNNEIEIAIQILNQQIEKTYEEN